MSPEAHPSLEILVGNSTFAPTDFARLAWGALRLPQELTGIEAQLVVLLGGQLPTASVGVASAYGIVRRAALDGAIQPGRSTLLTPLLKSNCPGPAWVARRLGYRHMSLFGSGLGPEPVPVLGSELVGVSATNERELMERAFDYANDPDVFVLAPESDFDAYCYHHEVTGGVILGTVPGSIAAVVSGADQPATFAAADRVKSAYPEALTVVVEGSGAGLFSGALRDSIPENAFVPLNLRLAGLDRVACPDAGLVEAVAAYCIRELGYSWEFGRSSIANIMAAIQVGRAEGFGPDDTIVVIGSDGWRGPLPTSEDCSWSALARLRELGDDGLADLTPPKVRNRLLSSRDAFWTGLVAKAELAAQRQGDFWQALVAPADQES